MLRFTKFRPYASALLEALSRSQAIIEFDLSGKILTANENFCAAIGYTLSEIVGRHHSMFVAKDVATSPEYRVFKVVKFAIDVTDRMHAVEELGSGLERLSQCNIRITR